MPAINNYPFTRQLELFLKYYSNHGVDKFIFYYQNASMEIQDLLFTHQQQLKTDIDVILWPSPLPTLKFSNGKSISIERQLYYRGQKLAINDCVLRETNRSKFLAIIDLDELIFPTKNGIDLLTFLDSKNRDDVGSFLFQSTLVHAGWMQKHTVPE